MPKPSGCPPHCPALETRLQPRFELLRAPQLPAPQTGQPETHSPVVGPFNLSQPKPWPDIVAADTHIPAHNWPPHKTPDSSWEVRTTHHLGCEPGESGPMPSCTAVQAPQSHGCMPSSLPCLHHLPLHSGSHTPTSHGAARPREPTCIL